jgi:transposase
VPHTLEGLLKLDAARVTLGVSLGECVVGLETAHNLLIDFLWSRQYAHIYVIPPSVVNGNRARFGQSGARTDASDALLLAEVLRTDRGRLQPWFPDTLLTRQIRAKVGWCAYLTREIVRASNRLRSVLLRYYPAALQMFSSLRTQIALTFIQDYPTPQVAAALTFEKFRAFAAQQGYKRDAKLRSYFNCLNSSHPPPAPETVLVYQEEAVQLAALLQSLVQAKAREKRALKALFDQHPDAPIFDSLPGAGELLAPSLLAKFGDDRKRFPSPASVQALAGTCPVTDRSGKRKVVRFRKACDRSGPSPRYRSRCGRTPIGKRYALAVSPIATRTVVWQTVGFP